MTSPNILQLSYSTSGGAGRAAIRLNAALAAANVRTTLLVQQAQQGDSNLQIFDTKPLGRRIADLRPFIDKVPLRLYPKRGPGYFSPQWLPRRMKQRLEQLKPDLLHLHWVNAGYFDLASLPQPSLPIVWTLHDMWLFTGGCHYAGDCRRFEEACGRCPSLGSQSAWDLSRFSWNRKHQTIPKLPLVVVCPSTWLAEEARESSLLRKVRIVTIPNAIDTELYQPIEQQRARDLLQLPPNKKIVLFSALDPRDPRKGLDLLLRALTQLSQDVEVAIPGTKESDLPLSGRRVHYLGRFSDDLSLRIVNSCADVVVAPSRQDNLPCTIMEGLACGTPAVAFDIGGMPDLIEAGKNGYLARPYDTDSLAHSIKSVITASPERSAALRAAARQSVTTRFAAPIVAKQHLELYEELVSEQNR